MATSQTGANTAMATSSIPARTPLATSSMPARTAMATSSSDRHMALEPMQWGAMPELLGPRHAYRVRRLVDLLTGAVPRGHILDAGCGAGTVTELLARRGYRVTAVDGSAAFVAHVRGRLERAGLAHRAQVVRTDFASADLPCRALDGAICGEVLEHLADDHDAVQAIAQALRPGGVLALSVPADPERFDWLDHWAGHERRYDESGLRATLQAAGFEIEHFSRWGFPFMTLYERFVQRPGLATAAAQGEGHIVARAARSAPAVAAFGALFSLDRYFEGRIPLGTGFLVRARRR
jgi:2-polyprenyl-3-methyl-5-hydroxy-6-metoxy-1,4-benzoquinol methylase